MGSKFYDMYTFFYVITHFWENL